MNTKEELLTKSLKLLRDGFKDDLCEFIYSNERFTDLLCELTSQFVEENIPLVDEDNLYDLGLMMMETLTLKTH